MTSFSSSSSVNVFDSMGLDESALYDLRVLWNLVQIGGYFAALFFTLYHAARSAAPARRTTRGTCLLLLVRVIL